MADKSPRRIAVIGLGYVGLPVAVAFGRLASVIAYDKSVKRIAELKQGCDITNEITADDLDNSQVLFTDNPDDLQAADFYIIAVPTPLDDVKHPNLAMLADASSTVAKYLAYGDVIVYESTVYPGLTEEFAIPLLETHSGLTHGTDFKVGYSPERINPGDKQHRFETITKVVSGCDEAALKIIADTYSQVITAGVYRAPNIKTAEAAKVIENTQRDLNIALMNELALIFDRMGIDTLEVLAAARTKWNFLPFIPGLVGGHCIGVDPYYLTYQAQRYGYNPEVILAGRRINDDVGRFIATQTIKQMLKAGYPVKDAKIGVLGLTFKKDCPDLRNTKVIDIITELKDYGAQCLVHDPIADQTLAKQLYDIDLKSWDEICEVDTIVIAVPHQQFYQYPIPEYHEKLVHNSLIIDISGVLDKQECHANGIKTWRL